MDRPEATSHKAVRARAADGGSGRARSGGARAWVCAAALAAIALAGCGSISASSTGAATAASPKASSPSPSPSPSANPSAAATQAALCQHTAAITSLEITHGHLMRVPQAHGYPSPGTVTTPAKARVAARALCALPLLPHGVFHCPNLTVGTTYLLSFTADGRRLPAVTVEATGCEVVTGVGPARWAAKSPGFWRTLATAANLSPPGRTAFIGGGGVSCQPTTALPHQANDCPAQNAPASGAVS